MGDRRHQFTLLFHCTGQGTCVKATEHKQLDQDEVSSVVADDGNLYCVIVGECYL